jgi:hypothetical protein
MDQGNAVVPGQRGIGDEGRKRGMEEGLRRDDRDLLADARGDDAQIVLEAALFEQSLNGGVGPGLGLELVPEQIDRPDDRDESDDRPEIIEIAFHETRWLRGGLG